MTPKEFTKILTSANSITTETIDSETEIITTFHNLTKHMIKVIDNGDYLIIKEVF
jgi:hypothetical protein